MHIGATAYIINTRNKFMRVEFVPPDSTANLPICHILDDVSCSLLLQTLLNLIAHFQIIAILRNYHGWRLIYKSKKAEKCRKVGEKFGEWEKSCKFAMQIATGVLAHLVERNTGSVEVSGSSPLYSTK